MAYLQTSEIKKKIRLEEIPLKTATVKAVGKTDLTLTSSHI